MVLERGRQVSGNEVEVRKKLGSGTETSRAEMRSWTSCEDLLSASEATGLQVFGLPLPARGWVWGQSRWLMSRGGGKAPQRR